MVATSFLSGIFGMAGGMILIGVLLALLPLPDSHGAACGDADGVERLARPAVVAVHPLAAGRDLSGRLRPGVLVWMFWRYVPSKPVALLLLGVTPFLVRLLPAVSSPNPERLQGAPTARPA